MALVNAGMQAGSRAKALVAPGEPTAQTDDSLPAEEVTMFGAAPSEAPGETWGLGKHDGAAALVRYTQEGGWSLGPALVDHEGKSLEGFEGDVLAAEKAKYVSMLNPLGGTMTSSGSGAILGDVGGTRQVLLVRNPGGSFQETPAVPSEGSEALLAEGEHLFGSARSPIIAALDEGSEQAGALVVPVNEGAGVQKWVLHWDGTKWTREQIAIPAASAAHFEVLALAASSPTDAWLLAKYGEGYPAGSVALFRRHLGSGGEAPEWMPVALKPGGEAGEPLAVALQSATSVGFTVGSGDQAQIMNVTGEGLWLDGERSDTRQSASVFLHTEGTAQARPVAAWCQLPTGEEQPCRYNLPGVLPTAWSRTFAWANPSTPEQLGERVITGFADGMSWRLEGTSFKRVPALGGTAAPQEEVGRIFGAAFSNAKEGWLGQFELPVHITLNPVPSRFTPWPASFRYPLLALAPQPGAPIGALSSEALAVGEEGEVARYKPGKGWLPESLLGANGREHPLLRAVAWPTSARAYAVGDLGQMWLWRGETGLWEQDPATPLNFRGNLLGIAFDPSEPARGYAVGQGGVLLRYGKTWAQEPTCSPEVPQPCLPPEVAGASFTSIAFAGGQALVAYREPTAAGVAKGGILVNEGSGWHVDSSAAKALGSGVPWAVAGLSDGGAGFTARGAGEHEHLVFEREAAGSEWQPVSVPGQSPPGALNLFREGGALRAVVLGAEPGTTNEESSPPPGSPPLLIPPFGVVSNLLAGVLRQSTGGWSDEEHELNNALEPPGEYSDYDGVYEPDPVGALLIGPGGEPGWAVGGRTVGVEEAASAKLLETADVWRYREEATTPIGSGTASVAAASSEATFAVGGGAQCAAPCAGRADAKIGPDVWLANALSTAQTVPGLRAFLYTGPRVTSGRTVGAAVQEVPSALELGRYAELLSSSSVPVYAASSPSDLAAGSEQTFREAFSAFPQPLGTAPLPGETTGSAGPGLAYSLESGSAPNRVRVIVLDGTADAGAEQREWLEAQLGEVKGREAAIVIGNADLQAQIAAGDADAKALAEALVRGEASAYFYDSPEQNLKIPLRPAAGQTPEIPSFGSGTLGYISYAAQKGREFLGASGFLLVHVAAQAEPGSSVHHVTAKLIPDIGELAIEAQNGTLLERSHAGLFRALARRPRAGTLEQNKANPGTNTSDPFIPIPSNCVGADCPEEIPTEFSFSSSNEQVGKFVEPNLAVSESTVLLGADGKPIPDSASGLFCALNPGTTTVTITAGGRSSSLPVTVEAGSVRRPCGTTPVTKKTPKAEVTVAPPPSTAPGPAAATPASAPPIVPVPPPPAATPAPPARPAPPVTPFFYSPLQAFAAPAFVPPPPPAPANPTPPSGTSAVTSPVEAAQNEEEPESAPESVSAQAVAYRQAEHEPPAMYLIGLMLLAAFAGASLRARPGRRGREIRIAPASISSIRTQQRHARDRRSDRWR